MKRTSTNNRFYVVIFVLQLSLMALVVFFGTELSINFDIRSFSADEVEQLCCSGYLIPVKSLQACIGRHSFNGATNRVAWTFAMIAGEEVPLNLNVIFLLKLANILEILFVFILPSSAIREEEYLLYFIRVEFLFQISHKLCLKQMNSYIVMT